MMKKYELTEETKIVGERTLYRIKALRAFGDVEAGQLGGFVETERNLDQSGNAWVFGDAQVSGNARVSGDAWVFGDAQVFGNAQVRGDAAVSLRRGVKQMANCMTCGRQVTGGLVVCRDCAPPRWVRVEERLPSNVENDWVLAQVEEKNGHLWIPKVMEYRESSKDWYCEECGFLSHHKGTFKVTHWMPLPEPPRREQP